MKKHGKIRCIDCKHCPSYKYHVAGCEHPAAYVTRTTWNPIFGTVTEREPRFSDRFNSGMNKDGNCQKFQKKSLWQRYLSL